MNKVALLKVKIILSTNYFEIRPVDFISKLGIFVIALSSFTITGNVLALGEEAELVVLS
jgi:hypothetical protein